MKNTLLAKLIACFLLLSLSMFVLLNTYGVATTEKKLIKHKKELLYEEANLISKEQLANYYSNDISPKALLSQLRTIDTFLDVQIWIVNMDGTIICDTRKPIGSAANNILSYDVAFFSETYRDKVFYPELLSAPMLSVCVPVPYKYQMLGYIVILAPLSQISETSVYYIDIANLCLLFFLPLLLLALILIYRFTATPVKKLRKLTKEYSLGNYQYPLPKLHGYEYKTLEDAISFMATQTNNLEDYQKKLVANVSHDFRSPLTSIQGYVSAIKDGTIPFEMKDKYLDIILFETERLTKLTQNILTLSSFDNKKANLELQTFDINKVIKQTAASFEGTCIQKKITIQLTFAGKKTLVNADIGKIQQVLYNLIDNAIKFSNLNSQINVSTEYRSDKVFVSVKDFGVGIPKDSILKIWERFYKTDVSRGKDKKGTGLGLSIAKEILQAHDENINVISTEGVGTEFIFTLTQAKSDN